MDSDVSEHAVSHIELTLPNRIFEVSYLMKREASVDFLAGDATGTLSRNIAIYKTADDHVRICLSVDNLILMANKICCSVDSVKAKNEIELDKCLNHPPWVSIAAPSTSSSATSTGSQTVQLPVHTFTHGLNPLLEDTYPNLTDPQTISIEIVRECPSSEIPNGAPVAPKRKRGRPKKDQQAVAKNVIKDLAHNPEGDTQKADENIDDYLVTPSGRRIRKPVRYREDVADIDEAVKEMDSEASSGGEYDDDDMIDPDFSANIISENDDEEDDLEEPQDEREKENTGDGQQTETEKGERRRGRPKKRKLRNHKLSIETKRFHASRGVKRPHYRREQNVPCKLCRKMYKDELSLMAHVQKIHSDHAEMTTYLAELKESAKTECSICGKILGNKRNEVSSHMMRVHGKEDDFISKCDECGMEFRRSYLLKEHKRRQHPKHDRILCHLCPASFKLKEYLTEHLRYTHNKQYKWQCDVCHKLTSSPKNLRRHRRLHESANFQCPICSKTFHEAGNMRRHILYVHNAQDVDRSQCPHCERDFSTKNNLIQHINSVHLKTSSYYCDICKKYFARKRLLLEHATVVHPGVPILSTKMDTRNTVAEQQDESDRQLVSEVLAGGHHELSLHGGDIQSGTTIILQAPDGTQHVLTPQTFAQLNAGGLELSSSEQDIAHAAMGDIVSDVNQQYLERHIEANGIDEASLSIATQALAAFEQAGGSMGSGVDGSTEHYISVIGEDGQEIRVQIVRRSTASAENSLMHAVITDEMVQQHDHVDNQTMQTDDSHNIQSEPQDLEPVVIQEEMDTEQAD